MSKLVVITLLLTTVACSGGTTAKPSAGGTPHRAEDPMPRDPHVPNVPVVRATGTPRADLIPRGVLFGNPERAAVRISPDGKWLSWLAPAADGVLNVWVAPVGKLEQATQVTRDTARPITQYWWAYTSKHLLYPQDTAGDENYHVFRVDLAANVTTDLTPFAGARASLERLDPKQPTKVVVSINSRDPQVFDLHRIDLVTGDRELLVENDDNFIGFTLDHALRPRLATKKLPDGATQISVRPASAKAAKGGWTVFDTIAFEDADSVNVVGFTPDNKGVYMIEPRGRDTAAFVEVDLATRKSTLLAADAKADAGGAIIHPTKRSVQAVSFEYARRRWQVLDQSVQRDLDNLATLDGGEVAIVSRTLDDKTWIVETTSEQHPAQLLRLGSRDPAGPVPVRGAARARRPAAGQDVAGRDPLARRADARQLPHPAARGGPRWRRQARRAGADGALRPRRPVGPRLVGLRAAASAVRQPGLRRAERQLPGLDRLRQAVLQRRQPGVGQGDARRPARRRRVGGAHGRHAAGQGLHRRRQLRRLRDAGRPRDDPGRVRVRRRSRRDRRTCPRSWRRSPPTGRRSRRSSTRASAPPRPPRARPRCSPCHR